MKRITVLFSKLLIMFDLTVLGCVYRNEPECEGESEVAELVLIENNFIKNQSLAVTKDDKTYAERYEILGYAKNRYGYGIPRAVAWKTSDPELIGIEVLTSEVGTKAKITVKRDLFDSSGVEPEAHVAGCVTNDCSYFEKDASCPPCSPEICSNPLRIQGVVNIEGLWKLEGATFPFPVEIYIQQTGYQIDTAFAADALINGKEVIFDLSEFRYSCELQDREHCVGEVINTNTGENLGAWSGTKTQ